MAKTYTIVLTDADDAKLREVHPAPETELKLFLCGSIDSKKRYDALSAVVVTDPANITISVT